MLRLPDGMRDLIFEAAKANGRSMNSEIIARLERSFLPSLGREFPDMPDEAVAKLAAKIAAAIKEGT